MSATKCFVEIGSCDFNTLNDLGKNGWTGVIIEPVQEYLNNLEKHDGVTYMNCAIDVSRGSRQMDVFKQSVIEKDRDFAGMSSFSEYTLKGNKNLVESRLVESITYDDMIKESGISQIDFLKIDTEGHDLVILNQVTYEGALRPKLIKAEHKHVANGWASMRELLESREYLVYQEFDDVYAIDMRTSSSRDPFKNHFEFNLKQ